MEEQEGTIHTAQIFRKQLSLPATKGLFEGPQKFVVVQVYFRGTRRTFTDGLSKANST